MVKIREHRGLIQIQNPINQEWQTMTLVVFEETGRGGVNESLNESNDFLSAIAGEDVGLKNIRTHTQPIEPDKAEKHFPVGRELNGYINRELHTTPQMFNQINKPPRVLSGRRTYFKTVLSNTMKEDNDLRLSIAEEKELYGSLAMDTASATAVRRGDQVEENKTSKTPETAQVPLGS
jgi:hypothetical protein